MTKWDKVFRIAVVLLLSANLAVSSIICARLANVTPAVGSGKNSSAEEKVEDYAEPIAPESPAATDAWYDYAWVYEASDYVEIIRLGAYSSNWHFVMTLPGANVDLTVKQIYVNDIVDGQKVNDFLTDDST